MHPRVTTSLPTMDVGPGSRFASTANVAIARFLYQIRSGAPVIGTPVSREPADTPAGPTREKSAPTEAGAPIPSAEVKALQLPVGTSAKVASTRRRSPPMRTSLHRDGGPDRL